MSEHCWHDLGIVYTSNPPQYDEKCCRCGKVRRVRGEQVSVAGHGSHVQVTEVREIAQDVGPCEEGR